MEAHPIFSIILPTYNRAILLSKAIESVLYQTYENWELIIIDDGSTDNTSEIAASFSDGRIKYFYQENMERSAARNNGIRMAIGDYICFLDSDDFYLTNHLEVIYNVLHSLGNPVAFLYSKIFQESDEILFLPEEKENPSTNNMEFIARNIIGPPQVCIHRNILNKHFYNNELYIGEDLDLWLRILNEFPLIPIKERTVVAKIHPGRTINIMQRNVYKESLKSFRVSLHLSEIRKKISPAIRRSFRCDCYLGIAKFYLFRRKKMVSFIMIIISMMYRPTFQTKYKLNIIYNIFFNFDKALNLIK